MTMAGTSYSFRIDGTERPSPLESTATWTQTGPRTWRTVYRSAVLSTDGREAPVTGPPTAVPPGMTASLKTTGPRTFDLAMKLKGVNVTTGHFTVAADGKSMSAETVSGPPGPTEERSKSFFERQ